MLSCPDVWPTLDSSPGKSTQLSFATIGGAQTTTLIEPAKPSDQCAIVLVMPAMGIRASYYKRLSDELVTRGMACCTIDLPGHGESPARASWAQDWGYRELVHHCESAMSALSLLRPKLPIIILGHSIGGQIALMSSPVPTLRAVVIVASGSSYWRSWPGLHAWRIRGLTALCSLLTYPLGYFPGDRVGFGGREARHLIRQWSQVAQTGSYNLEGLAGEPDFLGESLLANPGPDVHAINLQNDDYVPEAAMSHTLDKLTARNVTSEVWQSPPHGGDHNRWPSKPRFIVDRLLTLPSPGERR